MARVSKLSDFTRGWFIGNFEPSLHKSELIEVCLKRYAKGTEEPTHFQRVATEFTLVISGRCRIGTVELGPDDILEIPPGEAADFLAITDVVLVALKVPSIADDKQIGNPQ